MLFHSFGFLLAFLPFTWLAYFSLNRFRLFRTAQAALIAASFFFYGYQDWRLCFLLAASILVNFAIHRGLTVGFAGKRETAPKKCRAACPMIPRKALLVLGLAFNFGLLFVFKYLDFTIENLNLLLHASFALRHIALPLGISFYTFQQVSFVVDSYRRETQPCAFLDYALFVSFFPQLVAGPIVLHREMIPQFQDSARKRVDFPSLLTGMEYLIWGLFKKVALADTLGKLCDAGYENLGMLNRLSAAAVILSYTLEIYFDFSGYCDMAIGLGKLFHIDIPVNFRSPYKAANIADFWKRWHMTLTRFLTTYLYIPLGGSRKGRARTLLNVMIVFTLSGLWHGADWTFVLWGMLHGFAMVLYRIGQPAADRLPRPLSWLLTFLFVNCAWVFFRAENLHMALALFYRLLAGGGGGLGQPLLDAVCGDSLLLAVLGRLAGSPGLISFFRVTFAAVLLLGGTAVCAFAPSTHEIIARRRRKPWYLFCLALLFYTSLVCLTGVSKFIYFNF